MKRKLIIGTALALMVIAVLAVAIWMPGKSPLVTVAYESVSDRDAGQVWFRFHTTGTNLMHFRAYELQKANGRWEVVTNSETQGIFIAAPSSFGLSRSVPKGDHPWLTGLEYYPNPDNTIVGRARHGLWVFTLRRRWRNLSGWLNPRKPQTIYSPEMLGNKPVQKK